MNRFSSPMIDASPNFSTLVELTRFRSSSDRIAFTFLVDGENDAVDLTYAALDQKARAIASHIQQCCRAGDRALILYPPGLDYITAFLGCLYAGVVAVPAYPPRNARNFPRVAAIAKDAQPTLILASEATRTKIQAFEDPIDGLTDCRWLAAEGVAIASAKDWQEVDVHRDTLALLQYTSGSTSLPKGVMLSHGNLLHNLALISGSFQTHPQSQGVSWLPPYHDMGLIGGILQPIYVGASMTLMSPVAFLQRPLRWLQAISQSKATISGGPNFAYELCIQRTTHEQRLALDLSCWEVAFNGAELINAETLDRFAEAFAPSGFRREAFYACYGLAEATLMVTGGYKTHPPITRRFQKTALMGNRVIASVSEANSQILVSCGCTLPTQAIVIVEPETLKPCKSEQIGEIWVTGDSVAQGYWNQPEALNLTFRARLDGKEDTVYLRTGDLGFLQHHELFVTGRLKDLIIIRGRNYYPQDIEWTLRQSHPLLQSGASAAFAVETMGEERLVIVCELDRGDRSPGLLDEIVAAIRQAVAEQHDLEVYGVMLVKFGSIPKTSSGKIQHFACREAFLTQMWAKNLLHQSISPTVYAEVGLSLNTLHYPPQSPLAKGGRTWIGSLPFTRGGLGWGNAECSNLDSSLHQSLPSTVYTKVGLSLNTLHYPPQSPLGKGGRIWTGSLPFTRGGLGWGNAECSNLDSSVVSGLCVHSSHKEKCAGGEGASCAQIAPSTKSSREIQTWLISHIAEKVGITTPVIDIHQPLANYGLSSLAAVSLAGELEDWLKCRLSPTLIYEYPTIAALSQFLAEDSLSAEQGAVQKTQSNRNTIQPVSESVHDIAIIGMGCRFPGAENPEAFWELLQSGGDAIGEVPGDRWNPHLASHQGGFLSQVQGFDSSFFGIAPSEADQIDPQHRLLLEVAWEALEDAGQPVEKLSGSETGVFVGISSQDYAQMQSHTEVNTYAATGNAHGMVANRLSYLLNLQGPSLAVDTACSSSLVAVHLACQSLRSGECDLALAGGVNLMLSPMLSTALAQAGILSPEGRCKTFDASADGYGRGEGCGVVVLKPLSLALEAGDRILATIKGSAVNQDGLSNGLTAPNGLAQQRVIQKALQKAGVSPDQISYVEAHGTGTSLGDPIELSALKAVLMEGRSPNQSCAIGSVKPNIGHLEAAAGIAGLIKTILALQHRQIPPQLHLEQLNPRISLEASPFFISTSLQDWHRCTDKSEATDEYQLEHLALPHPSPPLAKGREQYSPVSPLTKGGLRGVMQDAGKKSDLCLNGSQILTDNPQNDNQRLAGVSSFGFGGTNAHVILAEASAIEIQIARQMEQKSSCQLLPLSARSPVALQTLAQNYRVFLQSETAQTYSLTDICYTASVRRSHHSNRLAVVGHSYSELVEQLDIFLQKATHTTKDSESQPEESTSLQSLAKFYQLGYPVDWSRLYPQGSCVPLPTYPWQRQRHWFCPSIPPLASVVELQQAKTQPSPHRLTRDRLLATPECDRLGLLESYFQQRLSRILGMGAVQLSIHAPLQTIGLDSLMVLELKHNLETDLKLTLGVSEFLDCPSLAQLASRVLATLTPPTSSSNISWEEGLL